MDDDFYDDNYYDNDDNEIDDTPIDGQIDISELFFRDDFTAEDEEDERESGILDGQISLLDDNTEKDNVMKKNDNIKDNLLSKLGKGKDDKVSERNVLKNLAKGKTTFKVSEEQGKKAKESVKSSTSKKKDVEKETTKKISAKNTEKKVQEPKKSEKVKKEKTASSSKKEEKINKAVEKEVKKTAKTKKDEVIKDKSSTKKTRKTEKEEKAELDKFFASEENAGVYSDIDNLNKNFEEVDVKVGGNVFGNIGRSSRKVDKLKKIKNDDNLIYQNSDEEIIDGVISKNIDSVMHECMISYAEHVILDRALPRVEDGLKPVQRRILYSMIELGITPDKPTRKCARIVGDCLGKYHPHGDTAVYEALVRMAQDFSCNEVLVTGEGNFGSVDGDGAAAMRYTEAKLSPLAMELLRDLDKNTVKWGLNFDDSLKEPEMLPGRFPNLLVNGSSGIAVGLATNIPPHNLEETIDGVIAYINNPNITLKNMMKIIKGPDFPTGGSILSNSELYEAYSTGRGKVYLRAKMHIEGANTDRRSIVITELPYQVNKANLLQKIALLKEDEKYGLSGISEIRDESDRDGMRAVIRLKKDADLKKVYNSLLKNTELQTTFGINMVAIAGGKPKQMSLLDIISYYSEYQREIIYRRSKYDLEQALERAHILQGLIIAIRNIDAVVKIIKTSKNTQEAKARLCEKFKLTDRQAQAILDMRLARLTSLEVYKLEEELKRLETLINKLQKIVSSKTKQYDIVKEELTKIKKDYGKGRLTGFSKEKEEMRFDEDTKEEVQAKTLYVLKSSDDMFKAVSEKQYAGVNKNLDDASTTPNDIYTIKLETNSIENLLAFTSLGNCYKGQVERLGESRLKDKGMQDWVVFKDLAKEEHIVAVFEESKLNEEGNLLFYTKFGMIKKTAKKEYNLLKKVYQGIKLKDGDEVLKVEFEPEEAYNLLFVTRSGMVLNAKTEDIPLQGRVAGGVKGISLADNDYCVGIDYIDVVKDEVVCVTDLGQVKRTKVNHIDESMRYRKGLKISNDNLKFACVIKNNKTLCLIDKDGQIFAKPVESINLLARTDRFKPFEKGKKLIMVQDAYLVE